MVHVGVCLIVCAFRQCHVMVRFMLFLCHSFCALPSYATTLSISYAF